MWTHACEKIQTIYNFIWSSLTSYSFIFQIHNPCKIPVTQLGGLVPSVSTTHSVEIFFHALP